MMVRGFACLVVLGGFAAFTGVGQSGAQSKGQMCRKVSLMGEVSEGQEWRASIGEGWIFRVVPIAPAWSAQGGTGYSGWDLAVDRETDGGFPDALMLATPPYGSLNEREIGTTFGLRAQDAVAWRPRRFHFLTSPKDLVRSRELYHGMLAGRSDGQAELLRYVALAAAGELQIVDAKLTPGVGDPPKFAEQWAMHFGQVPHTIVPASGTDTPKGELRWIRFDVTLWLPTGWKVAHGLHTVTTKCAE